MTILRKQIVDLDLIARDYGLKISRLARRMIQDEEIAKEAAQEVW